MPTWHFMFHRLTFSDADIQAFLAIWGDQALNGGLAVSELKLSHVTSTLSYVDMQLSLSAPMTRLTFEQILKYVLMAASDFGQAPLPIFAQVMQQPLARLNIEVLQLDAHSADVTFWQRLSVQVPRA